MKLKRHYDPEALATWKDERDEIVDAVLSVHADVLDDLGIPFDVARKHAQHKYVDVHGLPKISHVEVLHVGERQHINQRFIDNGVAQGWLTLGDGKLTFKTAADEDDFVLEIARVPGFYSCFTGEKLGGEDAAKSHAAAQHGESPDPQHPAGYRRNNYYECLKA